MADRDEVIKAFRKARIAGEKRLQDTKNDAEFCTEWEKYAFVMLGYELQLKSMGLVL